MFLRKCIVVYSVLWLLAAPLSLQSDMRVIMEPRERTWHDVSRYASMPLYHVRTIERTYQSLLESIPSLLADYCDVPQYIERLLREKRAMRALYAERKEYILDQGSMWQNMLKTAIALSGIAVVSGALFQAAKIIKPSGKSKIQKKIRALTSTVRECLGTIGGMASLTALMAAVMSANVYLEMTAKLHRLDKEFSRYR